MIIGNVVYIMIIPTELISIIGNIVNVIIIAIYQQYF